MIINSYNMIKKIFYCSGYKFYNSFQFGRHNYFLFFIIYLSQLAIEKLGCYFHLP